MASGRTHTIVGVSVVAATIVYSQWGPSAGLSDAEVVGRIAGAVMGILVTPDIDHHLITIEEKRVRWWLGVPVGKVWEAIWTPYRLLVRKHRGFAHWPVLGTVSRAAYIFLLFFWVPHVVPNLSWISTLDFDVWYQFVLFWIIQDLFHLLFDI